MRLLMGLVALAAAGTALAGAPCGQRTVVRQSVVVRSDAVVVPFATPIAVPVATVRLPSVLYAYGSPSAAVAPTPSPLSASNATAAREESSAELALRGHCLQCHRGAGAKGGLVIFDEAGTLRATLPRHVMWDMIARGKMPPEGAAPLDEETKRAIEDWARLPRDFEW